MIVAVKAAAPLISPAYDGGAGEQEVAAVWERRFDALLKARTETADSN